MGNENRSGPYELGLNPDLADLFITTLRGLAVSLRTHTMATVVSYNPATQRAVVLVDVLQAVNDITKDPSAASPNPASEQPPIPLTDVPVKWPRTADGYLTFALKTGDRGELHVQDRSIDAYLLSGLTTTPAAQWTHNLADAVFHPGSIHNTDPIVPPTSILATVLEGGLISLGRGATDFLVKGTTFVTAWTVFATTYGAAITVWSASVQSPADVVIYINSTNAAWTTLFGTIGTWLSTKVSTE